MKTHSVEIETPCLIIDKDLLSKNIEKMQKFVTSHGKKLRPHVKTHKCTRIARLQLEAGATGVCVAKLSEAEVLMDVGINDVLITGPVVGYTKIERLVSYAKNNNKLMIVTDNYENAVSIDALCKQHRTKINILADIDVGLGRTGVKPHDAVSFVKEIKKLKNLSFKGIQAYAGNVQHIHGYENRKIASLKAMRKAEKVYNTLISEGIECEVFTGTGTGTFDIDIQLNSLTDIQTGSYVLMDAEYIKIGDRRQEIFSEFFPAMRLLTSVVSVNCDDMVTVDAGLKSVYHHGAVPVVFNDYLNRYTYDWFGDEYGKIHFRSRDFKPSLGDVFELIVSHCDPTVNLFDKFFVLEKISSGAFNSEYNSVSTSIKLKTNASDNEYIIEEWDIDLRGKSQ